MAKSRQLPVRLDDDISAALDATAEQYGRSRAVIVNASLRLFFSLAPEERRRVLADYLLPERGKVATEAAETASKRGSKPKR